MTLGHEPHCLFPGVVSGALVLNSGVAKPNGYDVGDGHGLSVAAL